MIRKQHGVAGIEVLLLVTVAALLGFVVFKTYSARHAEVAATSTAQTSARAYKDEAELTSTQKQLDATDLDASVAGGDANELDQDLATF